ncbi:MAG: TrmH family RNA methyltransferase [bacterium]|nr:TrmH family RNA methyltransferase [bacterium]
MNLNKIVILDNLRSAHNVGNIYRSAYSFGFDCVIHVGVTPLTDNPKFLSSSRGCEKHLKTMFFEEISKAIEFALSEKAVVYSLEMNEKSVKLTDFNCFGDYAVVLGNEALGVSEAALEKSDKIISIETTGAKESLNVAVAFGIFAYSMFLKNK